MNAYPMPTYQFEMAPLDEFTVTERKYPKHTNLPKIALGNWFSQFPEWPDYELDYNAKTIVVHEDKPTDCEPQFQDFEITYDGKK